jgi:microcystin-dependent protein
MTSSFDNDQQTIVLPELVFENGLFLPTNGSAFSDPGGLPLGAIRTFADAIALPDTAGQAQPAQGQILPIVNSMVNLQLLFTVLANIYGGNGITDFALPNLAGRIMIGAGAGPSGTVALAQQSGQNTVTLTTANLPTSLNGGGQGFNNDQPSLGLNYLINTGGSLGNSGTVASLDDIGIIVPYSSASVPDGYMLADGQTLSFTDPDAGLLAFVLGDTFGGGLTGFALPNLQGRTIVGAGGAISLGQDVSSDTQAVSTSNLPSPAGADTPLNNMQPSLGLNYLIAYTGVFPGGQTSLDSSIPDVGEIVAYAGTTAPAGWLLADGRMLSISQYQNLFNVIGTTYGGNGTSTFALPNLEGETIAGTGAGFSEAETFGSNTVTLTQSETPTAAVIDLTATGAGAEQQFLPLDVNATVTDINLAGEATGYAGASVTIMRAGGADADDTFEVTNGNGYTTTPDATLGGVDLVSNANGQIFGTATTSAPGEFTIGFGGANATTAATQALVDDAVQHVEYMDSSEAPPPTVTLEYKFSGTDPVNGAFSVASDIAVGIQAINNPPTASIAHNFTVAEQQTLDLKTAGLSVADPDGESGSETLTVTVGEGTLDATVGDSGVTVQSGNDSSVLTLDGTIAELNALLGAGGTSDLTYVDNTTTPANVQLELTIDDNGNTGFGGPLSDSAFGTIDVTCYCPGTLIRTARGQKRVEKLKIGDKVRTASGAARPIKWIGKRSYAGRFVMGRKDVLPICIKAGALDEKVPERDLWISPHHAMYLDGALIEAKDLVNGISIVQAERVEKVEYFHVELETHDVIVAEGALAETYLDDDNRLLFHNARDYYALYQHVAPAPAHYCAPRLEEGYEVEAARRHIALRAGLLRAADGERIGTLQGSIEEIGAHRVAGWAQTTDHPEAPVCLDIYADGRLIGQVLANRYRDDLAQAGIGSGCHSFEFTSTIALSSGTIDVRRSLDGAAIAFTSDAPGALARASGIRHLAGRSDAFVRVHRRTARA